MRCFLVLFLVLPLAAADPKLIERGKYLVENVAMCADCHTPKTEKGELDRNKWMKGAVLDFQPLGAAPPNWKKTTPDLTAGSRLWVKWGELSMLKYLTTGLTPKGEPSAPPMPAYKFSRTDAEAVLEYLKSLK
jgi:mono/diheme cytochrome c family protein